MEPGFEDRRRDKVDFVENEEEAFRAAGCGNDLALDVARAGAVRIAGIEHV